MDKTSLGDRMKGYEYAMGSHKFIRRTPVIIRLDGKAFHTYTKSFTDTVDDPFSNQLHAAMVNTTIELCQNIQNVVLGYTQSDEISLLLRDWDNHETQQWFNGKIQKIVSVAAAMCSVYFNFHVNRTTDWQYDTPRHLPVFDARAFNLPKEEVCNYFIWRQQDASRNSVNMLGQHYFSHKKLHCKKNNEVQDMLMDGPKVNWNDLEVWKKRGAAVIPRLIWGNTVSNIPMQYKWAEDENTPIFTKDREYINTRSEVGE